MFTNRAPKGVERVIEYTAVFKGAFVYIFLVEEKDQLMLKINSWVS